MKKSMEPAKKEIEMFSNVSSVLKDYDGMLRKNKKYIAASDKFSELLDKIKELKKECEEDFSELEAKKTKERKELLESVYPVAKILQLYNFEEGNKKKHKKYSSSKDELNKAEDIQLIKYSKSAWKDANNLVGMDFKNLEKIDAKSIGKKFRKSSDIKENFGLSQGMVQKIDQLVSSFANSVIILDTKISDQETKYRKLKKKCSKADFLLSKKLDKYVSYTEIEDEPFYKRYMQARKKLAKYSEDLPEKKSKKS